SLGCQNCSGRTGALSGNISLGGTLSPKLLLGVSTNGWTKSDSGATLTVGTLTAAVRFYPSATGGFFMTGGLGLGTVSAGVSGFGQPRAGARGQSSSPGAIATTVGPSAPGSRQSADPRGAVPWSVRRTARI